MKTILYSLLFTTLTLDFICTITSLIRNEVRELATVFLASTILFFTLLSFIPVFALIPIFTYYMLISAYAVTREKISLKKGFLTFLTLLNMTAIMLSILSYM